jgi:predicted lactoylglutathione lyase
MKVIVFVKATKESEAGELPSEQLLAEMGKFNEELVRAGIMLAGEGLKPSSKGARVRFSGKDRTVIDGPFAETKELVAGFWIWQVKSMDEAIAWVKRCPNPMLSESEIEIRPVFTAEDFGEAYTPELQQQEERMRDEIERYSLDAPRVETAQGRTESAKIFVNLPVKNLSKSIDFFKQLGYAFNPQFTDETAACMVISDDIYTMLLTEAKFKEFTTKPISDATKTTEVLVCLSCESRDHVKELVRKAVAAGATTPAEPKDYGFMYQHGYHNLDGHVWELIYMEPGAVEQG